MALLRFKCEDCNLVFKKITTKNTATCSQCKKVSSLFDTKPQLSGVSYKLNSKGPAPQTTGVAGFDLDFDRAIAQSSRENWEIIQERQEVKKNMIENSPGTTGYDVGIDPDGYYYIMQQDKKEEVKVLRERLDEPSKVLNKKL